tara:strand:+ start:13822 stop:14121 length:300 start_codon:yes stop_codon:yes gene_type:complete
MSTKSKDKKLTEVKTVYARAAIVLLALNFGFTGYVSYNMNKTQTMILDSVGGVNTSTATTLAVEPTTPRTPQASLGTAASSAPAESVSTRDRREGVSGD